MESQKPQRAHGVKATIFLAEVKWQIGFYASTFPDYLSGKSAEMRYILAPAMPPISTTKTIEIEAINQSSIPKALNPIRAVYTFVQHPCAQQAGAADGSLLPAQNVDLVLLVIGTRLDCNVVSAISAGQNGCSTYNAKKNRIGGPRHL